MLDTIVSATLVDTFLLFPAALNTIGITLETPNPTNIKAIVQGIKLGNKTAQYNPIDITNPLVRITFLEPNFRTKISLKNRPIAIVIIKEV